MLILENISCCGQEVVLFRVAFLVACFRAFRINELVPGSPRDSSGRVLEGERDTGMGKRLYYIAEVKYGSRRPG